MKATKLFTRLLALVLILALFVPASGTDNALAAETGITATAGLTAAAKSEKPRSFKATIEPAYISKYGNVGIPVTCEEFRAAGYKYGDTVKVKFLGKSVTVPFVSNFSDVDSGKAAMDGAFWENTTWFWQTNWLIFECWLLLFIIVLMVVVSCFTPAPSKAQVDAITFSADFKKSIKESWGVFDVIGTLVVIGLCACFYAYFW